MRIERTQRGAQALTAALLGLMLALPCFAEATDESASPLRARNAELTGREIYARVLENRFRTYAQRTRLRSGDRAGNEQTSEFELWYANYRLSDDDPPTRDGVRSRSMVRYTAPFDLRHSAYLVVHNDGRPNDQFIYRPSQRRVSRVSLRSESVFGTDFSFEDILPRELDDARYERLADIEHQGVPCFRISAVPSEDADSEYSRFEIIIDMERAVPLQTLYWDDRGVPVKRLEVERAAFERIEGVWVAMRGRMTHLIHQSFTTHEVLEVTPNLSLERSDFDLRRLASSH